jgi:hypothetical protein
MRLRLPHAAARRQSHADDCLIAPRWPPKATYCPGFHAVAGMEVDLPPDAGGFREARASTVSDAAEQHKERRLLVDGIPSYVPRLDARPDTGYCMSREPACLGCSIAAPGRAWALHCTALYLSCTVSCTLRCPATRHMACGSMMRSWEVTKAASSPYRRPDRRWGVSRVA